MPFEENVALLTENQRVHVDLKRGPGYDPSVTPKSAYKTCYEVDDYMYNVLHVQLTLQ